MWSRLLLGAMLGAAVLLAVAVVGSRNDLGSALDAFDVRFLAPALGLALLNYAIRFARWQLYLHHVGVRIPYGHSAVVFAGGLAMSATPGKVGELFKAAMLRDEDGEPLALTAPVVVAERLTDLAAVALLAGCAVLAAPWGGSAAGIASLAILAVVAAVAIFGPKLGRLAAWLARRSLARLSAGSPGGATPQALAAAGKSFRSLLRPGMLGAGLALGVLAWLAECGALWLVLAGLGWHGVSAPAAVAVYATATLAGAVSLMPGGLGVTELSMAALLAAAGTPHGIAVAATLIVRLSTLWFAIALGLIVYGGHRLLQAAHGPVPAAKIGPAGGPIEAGHGR